jgi:hypothetical protein
MLYNVKAKVLRNAHVTVAMRESEKVFVNDEAKKSPNDHSRNMETARQATYNRNKKNQTATRNC